MTETCLLLILYGAGFALQIGGVVLVVLDIRDDRKTATRLADKAEQAKSATHVEIDQGPVTMRIGGAMGAFQAQMASATDSFSEFVHDRLTGRQTRKLVGVGLVLLGAFVALAANVIATV